MHHYQWRIGLFISFILVSGCATLFQTPTDENARRVLDRLVHVNKGLNQFKGIASIRMISGGKAQSGRIAFAAVKPDKMRIELLNSLGTPIISLSADGKYISVFSYTKQKQYRFRQSRTALTSIVHIPLGIEEMQSLLAGMVPLPSYKFAKTVDSDTPNQNIVLKNRLHGIVADLELDPAFNHIKSLRKFGVEGEIQYHIKWLQWKAFGEYRIPSRFEIDAPPHQKMLLTVQRFWPNVEVAPSTFILKLSQNQTPDWPLSSAEQ